MNSKPRKPPTCCSPPGTSAVVAACTAYRLERRWCSEKPGGTSGITIAAAASAWGLRCLLLLLARANLPLLSCLCCAVWCSTRTLSGDEWWSLVWNAVAMAAMADARRPGTRERMEARRWRCWLGGKGGRRRKSEPPAASFHACKGCFQIARAHMSSIACRLYCWGPLSENQ